EGLMRRWRSGGESLDTTPEQWLRLARRVRAEHPDVIPDERRTEAAGREAAVRAAWVVQHLNDGYAPLEQLRRGAARAVMWATEARERRSAEDISGPLKP